MLATTHTRVSFNVQVILPPNTFKKVPLFIQKLLTGSSKKTRSNNTILLSYNNTYRFFFWFLLHLNQNRDKNTHLNLGHHATLGTPFFRNNTIFYRRSNTFCTLVQRNLSKKSIIHTFSVDAWHFTIKQWNSSWLLKKFRSRRSLTHQNIKFEFMYYRETEWSNQLFFFLFFLSVPNLSNSFITNASRNMLHKKKTHLRSFSFQNKKNK